MIIFTSLDAEGITNFKNLETLKRKISLSILNKKKCISYSPYFLLSTLTPKVPKKLINQTRDPGKVLNIASDRHEKRVRRNNRLKVGT